MGDELRIGVAVKHGIDVGLVKADPSTGTVDLSSAPRKTSDFDKNAVEEAVRIRERRGKGQVTAISVGAPAARESLREALAIGADEAILVSDPALPQPDTRAVARALAAVYRKVGGFDLFLFGEGSTDHFSGLVGPRVAGELGIPSLSHVRRLQVQDGEIEVERDLEEEVEVLRARGPVVVTVGQEINTPRLPTFMANLKASKKEIRQWTLTDLGLSGTVLQSHLRTDRVAVPQVPRKRQVLSGSSPEEVAQRLLSVLRSEGVLP
jgi:electron transfer flavoprotein beta subunit